MTDLLPCPFCGADQSDHDHDTSWVRCIGCGAESGWNTPEGAIEAWNTRVDNSLPADPDTNADNRQPSSDYITLLRADVEALMKAAKALQSIRSVWTDPHNDNLMRKVSMTLDTLQECMK